MPSAVFVNSDAVIYNQLAQTAYLERLQDNLDVFNAASNGAIVYRSEAIQGNFSQESFYKVGGEIEFRDVNSIATIDTKKIAMGEAVGVKCPYKYGPYASTEEAFKRRSRNTAEFAQVVGQDMADALMLGRLKYALAALDGAIGANAAMQESGDIVVDGRKALTKAMRKFGDKFSRIALFVMNSETYFDIIDDAITDNIYGEGEIVVYGGVPGTLGKPVLVTDQVAENTVYALQAGAIDIVESQAPGFRTYDINDQENLAVGIRAEGTFNVEVLGYSYKPASGLNPTLAQVGTAARWQKHATDNKMTAGVILDLTPTPGDGG